MPVPFHAATRESRSDEATSERARLQQGARRALADEHERRRDERRTSKRHSQRTASWSMAALRVACAAGLLLVALSVLATKAFAGPGSWPQVTLIGSTELRSGGGQILGPTITPGSGHHYTGHQVSRQGSIRTRALPGSGHHYTGHQSAQTSPIQPRAIAVRPRETFHWADAGVGAGFALALSLLVAGGALAFSRRSASRRHVAA